MEFFKPGKVYDFMGQSRRWMTISLVVCTISLAGWIFPGANWGTDFSGGTEMEISFRKVVNDGQLRSALASLGFSGVDDVRQGKYIELDLGDTDQTNARARVDEMCKKLLANTVIENYSVEIG